MQQFACSASHFYCTSNANSLCSKSWGTILLCSLPCQLSCLLANSSVRCSMAHDKNKINIDGPIHVPGKARFQDSLVAWNYCSSTGKVQAKVLQSLMVQFTSRRSPARTSCRGTGRGHPNSPCTPCSSMPAKCSADNACASPCRAACGQGGR